MRYQAVIFDLFGTLIDNLSEQEYASVRKQMASGLSVPLDDFNRLWSDTAYKRNTGVFLSIEENIEYIGQVLNVPFENTQIKLAAQIRNDYTTRCMTPRADAIEVLSHLKSQGYQSGLISDCTPEVPVIWKETPFAPLINTPVFSCLAGFKKPDPRIYYLVMEQLAVEPEKCLYIGDGDNQELTGAAKVGMHPVLIRLDANSTEPHLIHRESWYEPSISSLSEVITLLD